ncbi:anti-phage dCTP deaminase [Roseateles sp. L2-2]|uniref:anti-phage dCTP deaminase n=1 Tax=Roseateles TaxID=93681 RepID=UPI003D36FA7E
MQHGTEAANDDSPIADRATPKDLQVGLPELFFGFVGPTGVDLNLICETLASQLNLAGYETRVVSLGDLIDPFMGLANRTGNEFERLDALITKGTKLRRATGNADIVARLGLAHIRVLREQVTGSMDVRASHGLAYLVKSFCRPEEVALFREVYGQAFLLVSAYAPRESRRRNLALRFAGLQQGSAGPEELAIRLMARDHAEDTPLGQKVGDVFPLADYFVLAGRRAALRANLKRLVQLVFAEPFVSPTRDEQGMFFAHAAALRSQDLSRQVGAAITSAEGDIVATGCNEVPKSGGGLYWAEDDIVVRDAELGHDANVGAKTELVTDTLSRMKDRGWLAPHLTDQTPQALARAALLGRDPFLRRSRVFDVIEYGRAVHAEMAAITQAAKDGRSLKGTRLYCTTFPCHLCARHILASGIADVLFIEPYEKSRTDQLHADAISVEPEEPSRVRTNFRAFVGVAPRRYMEFFSIGAAPRKTDDGQVTRRAIRGWGPRFRATSMDYITEEQRLIRELPDAGPDSGPGAPLHTTKAA